MVKIGPVVFEKKMVTDGGRCTTDDRRQPIAICDLRDSGDLIKC